MEIWMDTARDKVVDKAKAIGVLHGITTNPKLIADSGLPLETVIANMLAKQDGPVAVQVMEDEVEAIVRQGEAFDARSHRLIVKIPVTVNGLIATHRLARLGITVMATAVFEPYQALLAMRAGAGYIALYYGRISDQGHDPEAVLKQTLAIKNRYKYETKILVASIRELESVNKIAELGADAATFGEALFEEMIGVHPGISKALDEFATASLALR